MAITCLVSSGQMVGLKGGGLVGNGEFGANRLLNTFSLSDYDNAWYLDSS